MPKRKNEEKIQYYESKIQKLRDKQRPASVVGGRRRIIYSDSSSDGKSGTGSPPSQRSESHIAIHESNHGTEQSLLDETEAPLLLTTEGVVPKSADPPGEDQTTVPDLDPEILTALGARISDEPEYGENIHDNLSQLWQPILKKGLPKEVKESTLKQYLVPQNCTLLQAPKLNLEIAAALTESARNKDRKIATHQQQLAQGITAVNRAMDTLLNKDDGKLAAIQHLSNACRILCDLHHVDSQVRVKLISPNLDKTILNIIQDCQRDETLFGTQLSEKIKSTKAIEKQRLQIKKTTKPVPPASAPSSGPSRGNWRAPPRYPANSRGTRGGYRRAAPARRQAPPPQTRQASRQQQPRAPPPPQ